MNLLNPGVQFIIITDPTNEESVLLDGNYLSPNSTLEKEQLTRGTNARGGVNHLNEKWELNIEFADSDVYSALKALPKQRSYQFTIVKLNGFVFFVEDQTFLLNESAIVDPESEDYPYSLQITDIQPNPDIRQVLNAMAPFQDLDSNGLADGFTLTGTTTAQSFTSGVQSLTSAVDITFFRRLIIPVNGLTLEYSVDLESLHANGNVQRFISFKNISGTEISNDNSTFSTTGIKTRTITLPTNTFYVDVGVRVTGVSASGTLEFSKPSLQLRSSEFVNY